MEDDNDNSIQSENSAEKQYLIEFIKTWETYPELWCTSIDAYRDKNKKNCALDKLLDIYKKIRPNSTREDVKKKLNSLRTNFRKELKKIIKSKSSGKGINEIYVPSSWTYYELQFLSSDEQPVKKMTETDTKNDDDEDQHTYSISSIDLPPTPSSEPNKRKKRNDQQNILKRTLSFLEKDSSEDQEEYHLAKVWALKIKNLEPMQKLFAEKAIHDILFEAQLGKLNKNSVKVNEHVPYFSSPLPAKDIHSPSPSPSPNTQDSFLIYSSNPSSHSVTFEHADSTRAQTFSKPSSHHQPIIATGVPSQIILRPQSQLYVPPNTISRESTYDNKTSNIIISADDVHAEDTFEENIVHYFKEFK